MPAAPVIENIAQAIEDALNDVKVASGYSIDLKAQRRNRVSNNPEHGLCIIAQGARVLAGNPSHRIQMWDQEFILDVVVVQSEKAEEPIDRAINYAAGDICRALMADPHWGQTAHDTKLESVSPLIEGDNGFSGFTIAFRVQFADLETDPTSIQA